MPTVKLTIRVAGLSHTLALLRKLPKTAQDEIRVAAQAIADDEAERIRTAGRRESRLTALVAGTVKSRRDRIPSIAAGGARKVSPDGARGGDVFFGAEFGGGARPTTQQFRPHRGHEGYFFYPTLRADQERMLARWMGVVDAIAREWETP